MLEELLAELLAEQQGAVDPGELLDQYGQGALIEDFEARVLHS